jgi:hypothetical protein
MGVLKNNIGGYGLHQSCLGREQVGGMCKQGNEFLGSVNKGNFFISLGTAGSSKGHYSMAFHSTETGSLSR